VLDALVGHPYGPYLGHGTRERSSHLRFAHVGEHGRVVDDQRRVLRRLRRQPREVAAEVSHGDARWVRACDFDRSP
jgi:hypothetical protein